MPEGPGVASPLDMMTDTDVHALRRVSRMFRRMETEAQKHRGHGPSCPFDRDMEEDLSFADFLLGMAVECDDLVEAYEKVNGPVVFIPAPDTGRPQA